MGKIGGRTGGKKRGKAAPEFDIEAAELPQALDDAAMTSGGYPYDEKMKRKRYDKELLALQIELLKMQAWAQKDGKRIVVVFEGRDGAGKGGAIHRFIQHLNPRHARVVALTKPTETERGQWYFQRYAAEFPTAGEIALFDRSWYNRAGVEPVMGFCTPQETETFLREAPSFEGQMVRSGTLMFKFFLEIGREMQMKRLHARFHDPLKRWKLSPIDFQALDRFDAYTDAFATLLERTHTDWAPWTYVRANDKLRTRLEVIRHVLAALPYAGKDEAALGEADGRIISAPPG